MPTFTISKDGQTLNTLTLEGERIELGSANTCKLFIDDLLVSLHQAAFLKTKDGYDIEPIARTPSFTMNGEKVDQRKAIVPNAVIAVEGYEIRVNLGAGAGSAAAASLAPPLPAPLDLPPEPPPLPPIEPARAEPPKPPLPPLPPLDPPKAAPTPQPPREGSLPPLPPPLPPIPEPLFAESTPPQAPPPKQSAVPPPLPPLPPLEPPPKAKSAVEAATQYVVPIKPIGQLVSTAGPLKGKSWPLAGSELKIGREQGQNDILIRFDAKGEIDTSISRRHASIHIEGDYAYVEDQGSVAGTFVNGRQASKGERIPLHSGDEIVIRSAKDNTVFRVELLVAAPSPSAAPPLPAPSFAPPPPSPSPAPRFEPPPEPSRDSRSREKDGPREREPIRRRERRPRVDDDNPFAPIESQGMPQWVWFAIGGAVVVIVLILVFLFT